ncbi:MAG: photosynthetic complex putative assembly protein PuhB [Sphingomonadaceae bacterium]
MSEHDFEPVPGLPGRLPRGETMLWQGKPDWKQLAVAAFHIRPVALYFVVLAVWGALSGGSLVGIAITIGFGALAVGVLSLMAWFSAHTTIYTLTDRRMVLRIGMAVSTCINLPLGQIGAADLKLAGNGSGDIALRTNDRMPLGYAMLWPHARPWTIVHPQPMLRAVPEARKVAALLARACGASLAVARAPAQPEALAA